MVFIAHAPMIAWLRPASRVSEIARVVLVVVAIGVGMLWQGDTARCQWKSLTSLSPSSLPEYGAMCYKDGKLWCGRDKLYLSTDIGITWSTIALPSSASGFLYDIDFADKDHGVVVTSSGVSTTKDGGMTWQTLITSFLSNNGFGSAILLDSSDAVLLYYQNTLLRASGTKLWSVPGPAIRGWAPIYLRASPDRKTVYALGTSASPDQSTIWSSTDRGVSWTTRAGTFGWDTWSFAIDSCDPNKRYVANENYYRRLNSNCSLFRTLNAGQTWDSTFTYPLSYLDTNNQLIGSIVSSTYAVYAQTHYTGVLRSSDYGATWTKILGPSNTPDTRQLTIVNDSILIACDTGGNVWKYVDHDAIRNVAITPPVFSADTLRMGICDTAHLVVRTVKDGCKVYAFDSLSFNGSGSTYVQFRTGSTTTVDSGAITSVNISATDTGTFPFDVRYRQRNGVFTSDGVRPLVVIVTGNLPHHSVIPSKLDFGTSIICKPINRLDTIVIRNDECETVLIDSAYIVGDSVTGSYGIGRAHKLLALGDTVRLIVRFHPTQLGNLSSAIIVQTSRGIDTLPVLAQTAAASDRMLLSIDTLFAHTCDSASGVLRLTNTSCYTLRLTGIDLDTDFTVAMVGTLPQLPLSIGEAGSENVTIQFRPNRRGLTTSLTRFHLTLYRATDTVSKDTTIAINGFDLPGRTSFAVLKSSLDLGVIPLCSSKIDSIQIINTGCDSILVSRTTAGAGYEVLASDSLLAPNETGTYRIVFDATRKGSASGMLHLHADTSYDGTKNDFDVPILASVGPGSKILAANQSALSLGSLRPCESHDTSFWIWNRGCDTLTISNLVVVPMTFHSSGTYPISIPPGDSTKVDVQFIPDTAGHASGASGQITIYSNSDSSFLPIQLTGGYIYPALIGLQLASDDSGKAGSIVTFKVVVTGAPPPDLTAIHFDLTHDDDLLGYRRSTGVTLGTSTNAGGLMTQSFTIAPPVSGEVGTLTFQTFLAKHNTTALTISNVRFDSKSSLPADCIASLSDSGTGFHYIYSCGDKLMQDYMATGSFQILSIVPNPARDEIVVSTTGSRGHGSSTIQPLSTRVYDALGVNHPLAPSLKSIPAVAGRGDGSIALDVSEVPNGVYYLRMESNGCVATKRFVVER